MTGDDVPGENATRGRPASPGRDKDGITITAAMRDEGRDDRGAAPGSVWDGKSRQAPGTQARARCRGASIDSRPQPDKADAR